MGVLGPVESYWGLDWSGINFGRQGFINFSGGGGGKGATR